MFKLYEGGTRSALNSRAGTNGRVHANFKYSTTAWPTIRAFENCTPRGQRTLTCHAQLTHEQNALDQEKWAEHHALDTYHVPGGPCLGFAIRCAAAAGGSGTLA